jgi:RHS repeat-associated protein
VVNQYSYLPFGEAQTATEGVTNRIRYAGRELESMSGLYYNNARWYDPQLHRFISEDPIGIAGGLNLYSYTANDPVNFVDPSGLDYICYFYVSEWEMTTHDANGRAHKVRFTTWDLLYCDKADEDGGRGKTGSTSRQRDEECARTNFTAAQCWALMRAILFLQRHPDEVCQARGWTAWSRMLRGAMQFDPDPATTARNPNGGAYARLETGVIGFGPTNFSRPAEVAQTTAHEETHFVVGPGHRRYGTYSGPPGTDPYEVGTRCSTLPAGSVELGGSIQQGSYPWN